MNPDTAAQLQPCPRCALLPAHETAAECIAALQMRVAMGEQELQGLRERVRGQAELIALLSRAEAVEGQ